ncbi:MAG TPA: class IV adenylate cyclase [Bellilinea sp.]|nr:class IV adenylate cyclase [Bellilinea sp.]
MKSNDQELEVKYLVRDLPAAEAKFKALGAVCVHRREKEINLRFDRPDGSLTQAHQVLRLRQDHRARLTFKGPQDLNAEANLRTEIETTVEDFSATQRILEAVGFVVSTKYEKWRTTYEVKGIEAVLDELPFGSFIEVEGTSESELKELSRQLSLDWSKRVPISYLSLFDSYKQRTGRRMRYLDFRAFARVDVKPADLGLDYAD